jgi:beta-galactosidase
MKGISRREILKTGLLVPAAAATAQVIKPSHSVLYGSIPQASELEGGLISTASSTSAAGRERLLLDFGWRFHFGHANDSAKDFGYGSASSGNFQKTGNFMPASLVSFDDTDWQQVNLPHDWAVELPFQNDADLASKGFHPLGRKYPETSVGWYRRVFEIPAEDAGKRITIEFDGVYRGAMVVFNGYYIGCHRGGYDSFSFDVSGFTVPDQPNVLLVRVDATESDGWFYEGAGIYRHVWLVKTHPVHVKRWGTFVRSEIDPNGATLSILTEVENHSNVSKGACVVSTIVDPSGAALTKEGVPQAVIQPGGQYEYRQQLQVKRPRLWSPEERNLYKLMTEVVIEGETVDRYETPFGIRSIEFDAAQGLKLNGVPLKLKGTCNHQDHAGIGVAIPDAVQYYRIGKLQEMGSNALRTAHNPPTPELLDACDRLGMLVLDETRMMSSNPEGLLQFENLVRRDRNHPSVFMWSMGNEENEANRPRGVQILTAMKAVAEKHDGSRPVTIAPVFAIGTEGLSVGDVAGYNYRDPEAAEFHKSHPDKPVMGTENVSAVGTRGIYITDKARGVVNSYDPYTTTGRASAEGWWRFCNSHPWLAGGFVWTGFDYRGEPSPNGWPNVSSQYGILDTCGFPKDTFYYYQSWWTNRQVFHLFPHWNWAGYEGKTIAVWVYTNLDRVELFHNGMSLGTKEVTKDSHVAWNVKYAPGALEARGWKNGKQVMTARRETTGPAAKLVLHPSRNMIHADGEDVAMLAVDVQDSKGRTVPITDCLVTFRVDGPGKLIGVGNGDPTDQSPDKANSRRAFSGCCLALVQSSKIAGAIEVEATSPGLALATTTILCQEVQLRPQVDAWDRNIPKGAGITGFWRPLSGSVPDALSNVFGTPQAFTFTQNGDRLTGYVEGSGGLLAGADSPVPINGKVEGSRVSFAYSVISYEGKINGEEVSLQRSINYPLPLAARSNDADRPAIGPAPDGSDPSLDLSNMLIPTSPMILRRVLR